MVIAHQAHHFINDFDPHFKIFHELMPYKVREILLVSSPYDAYILEEDGSLASRIINEYRGLNLSLPPRITRVATPEKALQILKNKRYDIVVTMPHLGSMDTTSFSAKVKALHADIPVILLTHSVRDDLAALEVLPYSSIDNTYVWCCDSDILLAIVKNVEDEANVDFDTRKAMVRVIILVEDTAVFRSSLLPILYKELVKQTQAVLDEGLNEQHRLLKMRARPKILTAASYEEALDLFTKYRPYVFCVMSDVRFPKDGKINGNAGFELLQTIRQEVPDLPLLMLSTEIENGKRAKDLPAVFIEKNSTTLREEIHSYFLNHLGFGDFIFRTPDGSEIDRASNLHEFEEMLKIIPEESLVYHAGHNHFSNWVMARAEIALAARLHRNHFTSITNCEDLRQDVYFKVHALRKLRQQGIVAQFSSDDFDPAIMDFVRMGRGSMGGKARGIAFFSSRLRRSAKPHSIFGDVPIVIPQTCVITADGFDDFIAYNDLFSIEEQDDEIIAKHFLEGIMPPWLHEQLGAYLTRIKYPLSIRSSSLLEDAQFRPYAGLYNTFMLPNNHPDFAVRLNQLEKAIKLVYASTWYESPRSFSRSIGQVRDDSMAVIIQKLVGREYGDYFYPAISGVAQSYNYYPIAPMQSEDGIAHIALGFGKTVVEGERSLRFSPGYPKNLPQFSTVDDILTNSQRSFYCLSCSENERFVANDSNLRNRMIDDCFDEVPVRLLCSTYFPEEHRIRDVDLKGHKVLTFAPLLKYDIYPLPEVLRELLSYGREGMGCEVEIEFALDLADDPMKSTFYFLQIRPIVTGSDSRQMQIDPKEFKKSFIASGQALGHGLYTSIQDIVYVKPESFDTSKTKIISREVGQLNRSLHKDRINYMLIGPGRWGTADPWLGIPVQWSDISGVSVIVELQGYGLQAEVSQGSHFFQNITSLGIPYLMVRENSPSADEKQIFVDAINWNFFKRRKIIKETEYIRHIRLPRPFTLKVNGHTSEAAVFLDKAK